MTKPYIPVKWKFYIGHILSFLWLLFTIWISRRWLIDLSEICSFPLALFIITGIAYIPGYLNSFLVVSLLLDKQPKMKEESPKEPITILIAAWNEQKSIGETLRYIQNQDYEGKIKVIVIDNNSTDQTKAITRMVSAMMGIEVKVIVEKKSGKHNALNTALNIVETEYMITLDADTILHKSAIRYLVARMQSAPRDVCAVAGAVLVKNSRENIWSKIQEWDYFLSIASIKRLQGLYQGTLVAQGAYSLYKTEAIKKVGGWEDCIGEDIVLTWRFLEQGWKVYFEPTSVAFTDVPVTFKHFARQRSRWARGMIEGLKRVKPWQQPLLYAKYLTGINLIMPYLDLTYTLFWLPGLILSFFGIYWIVGLTTILVIPLTLISYYILYKYQKRVFKQLNLKIRKNKIGFFLFVFFYQMIMSPVSVYGYFQEMFKLKRVWK